MNAREIVRLMNEEEFVVLNALKDAEKPLAEAAEKVAEAFRRGGRTIYVGSGTSGRIALADAAEMPPTFGIDRSSFVALVSGGDDSQTQAKEDAEDDEYEAITALNKMSVTPIDILIGITASGRTPFVVAAVRHARQKGLWTCGIVNNKDTPLFHAADLGIFLNTGAEVLTGSTRLKAGTAQKLALNRISTAAMVLSGKVISNLMVDVKAKNGKLKDRCARIVHDLTTATVDEAWDMLEKHEWNVRTVVALLKDMEAANKV
jgi:N-acetylmuramic acid 6-phosphate etherase